MATTYLYLRSNRELPPRIQRFCLRLALAIRNPRPFTPWDIRDHASQRTALLTIDVALSHVNVDRHTSLALIHNRNNRRVPNLTHQSGARLQRLVKREGPDLHSPTFLPHALQQSHLTSHQKPRKIQPYRFSFFLRGKLSHISLSFSLRQHLTPTCYKPIFTQTTKSERLRRWLKRIIGGWSKPAGYRISKLSVRARRSTFIRQCSSSTPSTLKLFSTVASRLYSPKMICTIHSELTR